MYRYRNMIQAATGILVVVVLTAFVEARNEAECNRRYDEYPTWSHSMQSMVRSCRTCLSWLDLKSPLSHQGCQLAIVVNDWARLNLEGLLIQGCIFLHALLLT